MWRGKWIQVFPWWIFDHIFVCVVFWSCSENKNYKELSFCTDTKISENKVAEDVFVHAKSVQDTRRWHIQKWPNSFQSMDTMCSAIVLVGWNCSVGLFPCFSLEGILSPQGIFFESILLLVPQSSRSPSQFYVRMSLFLICDRFLQCTNVSHIHMVFYTPP